MNTMFSKGGTHVFQHTAARRRLAGRCGLEHGVFKVSTHSRPKAAGENPPKITFKASGFNTQPPEGGWRQPQVKIVIHHLSFNTQPPEGGWLDKKAFGVYKSAVSTHSRPKAAGADWQAKQNRIAVSTHSRPKAAGRNGKSVTI